MKLYPLVLATALGVTLLSSNTARAENCATLEFSGGEAQEIIIGEYATVISHHWGETLAPSGEIGVCWRDANGVWTLEQPTTTEWVNGFPRPVTCDTSTPDGDMLLLTTGAGDDTVTTLLESQTYAVGGSKWIHAEYTPGGTTNAMFCGTHDYALAPWNPDFEFGVTALLGTGTDRFFGTPNDDIAHSNVVSTTRERIPAPWGPLTTLQHAPGDNASDVLCGGYGDDQLLGDADDGPSAEETLDGGYGEDYCDGDPHDWGSPGVGGDVFDVARHVSSLDYGCNTIERAITPASYSPGWSMVHECWAIGNPVTYFDLD